jgi:hypothetical protein
MKVAGFSFIRNAEKFDYPIREALESILPLCDEIFVAVGNSEDNTLDMVSAISPKIKTHNTDWDDNLRKGGRVLAVETDKALAKINNSYDWAVYIQGDEVLHEDGIEPICKAMQDYRNHYDIDGLLLRYRHFYGSYDYIGDSFNWYRNEIRVIKPGREIYSYGDAQGFRKKPNKRLKVKPVEAYMHHYGWVKDPRAMQKKQETFNKLWHDDQWVEQNVLAAESFDYSGISSLAKFSGSHPKVMQRRIQDKNWEFSFDLSRNKYRNKEKVKRYIEKITGWRPGEYKNYKLI